MANISEFKNGFVLVTSYQSDIDDSDNMVQFSGVVGTLKALGIEYASCLGMYQGEKESSIALDIKHIDLAKGMAKQFYQDSILVVNKDKRASLLYTDDQRSEEIGKWLVIDSAGQVDRDHTYELRTAIKYEVK